MQRNFIRRILFGSFFLAAFAPSLAFSQNVPSSAKPGYRSCAERTSVRSEHSREPTTITFVNKSGMYRGLMWIDPQGQFKDYGGLNSGEKKSINTFRTHPWMITTGPGDCIQIIMPAAEPATVTLK